MYAIRAFADWIDALSTLEFLGFLGLVWFVFLGIVGVGLACVAQEPPAERDEGGLDPSELAALEKSARDSARAHRRLTERWRETAGVDDDWFI